MKKINLYIAGIAALMLGTGCSHEMLLDTEGEGKLVLHTTVSTDMQVVSRAVEQDLQDNCMIWISNAKGLVRRYDKFADMPQTIDLASGHYVAEAWTGDSVPASWTARWFKGMTEFDITKGQTTQATLQCKIANVAASVKYTEGLEAALHDFSMSIGHAGDTLLYVGREERMGYFMMPSFDKNLTFTLTGKQVNESDFTYTGTIENAKPGTHYIINVKYTQETNEVGGGIFSIEIDEEKIDLPQEVELIAAPKFTGYGFDVNLPVTGEANNIGERVIYVSSATEITVLHLKSDLFFEWVPALSSDDLEWFGMNEQGKAALTEAGINIAKQKIDNEEQTLIKIGFSADLLNGLEDGKYSIDFKATDKDNKVSSLTMNIIVSNAYVIPTPVEEKDASYFSVTLHGTMQREGLTNVGFNYRKATNSRADDEWTFVEGHFTDNQHFEATINDLTPGTTYEYTTVCDGYIYNEILSIKTRPTTQLPNSGFEDWFYYNNKIWVPGTGYPDTFWDSGNHGGATVSKNFTTRNDNYKHSGNYSACLKSEKVVIQFAAGNIFAGKYLATDGTNGVLGWGRPFTETPKSVNIWVKYVPVNVTDGGSYIKKGDLDQGIIYMALVDDTKQSYNGEQWPCVIKTKAADRNLFDKDGDNVIAYGEHVFTSATDGDDLILINIPLEYYKEGVYPSNIIFVASASRYGDYFQGGSGSTMYIDDIELIYE
ncbi:MAG: DUF4493 domain-containing protein [Muribaculaceae bacterium]|nr:DUF4493 domain-containing protein [Muribaculaceae bacterium]